MTIKSVGSIGSGIIGSGIAQVAATKGFDVVLRSRKQESADQTVAAMQKSLEKLVAKERMSQDDADAAVARVRATSAVADLADCDLVIESVVEDLPTKLELFDELDKVCKDGAILATNTSTLSVTDMAVRTSRPERDR